MVPKEVRMDQLNTLASICESAQRMPISNASQDNNPQELSQQFTTNSPVHYLTQQTIASQIYQQLSSCPTPTSFAPCQMLYPTPPVTPNSFQQSSQAAAASTTIDAVNFFDTSYPEFTSGYFIKQNNPVLRNIVSHTAYMQFLDDTWPEKCARRGSAVIRASLYSQIANSLKGGVSTARFRYWIRKIGFFLIEKKQPNGDFIACIAVPINPKQAKQSCQCSKSEYKPYRLVARLEDFAYLIGEYHNDKKGHYGIRKTYQLIQQDFAYLPRAAVAKYVQLCDICSMRGKRSNNKRKVNVHMDSHNPASEVLQSSSTILENSLKPPSYKEEDDTLCLIQETPMPPSPEEEIEITTDSLTVSRSRSCSEEKFEPNSPALILSSISQSSFTDSLSTTSENSDIHLKDSSTTQTSESLQASTTPLQDECGCLQAPTKSASTSPTELSESVHMSMKQILDKVSWEDLLKLYSEATQMAPRF